MSLAQVQRQSFEERLKRINAGAPNTMGEVQIGPRDEREAKKSKPSNTVRVKPRKKKNVRVGEGSNLVMLPLAVLIGALSVFAGRAAAFHMFAEGGLAPVEIPIEALVPYVGFAHLFFAGFLALAFTWTFALNGMLRKLAVVAGFAAMLFGEPQMIERFPDTFATFFSKDYVAQALG